MRNILIVLGMALLAQVGSATSARAGVEIAPADRVHDPTGNRCGWCALETLARHHGILSLAETVAQKTGRAAVADLEAALDAARADYRVQDAGLRYTLILRYAVREKRGALVGFHERSPGAGRHIVTLIDFGADGVRVIDPNDADGRVRTMSLRHFLSWWDGFALVIDP